MSARDVIFVLGHGRSGTSAVTRVLALCGCHLPRSVLAPGNVDWNPKGFWESIEAMKLNFDFMLRHPDRLAGPGRWLDVTAIDKNSSEAFIGRIQSFLSHNPAGSLLIKAGGIVHLIEFWLEAARREGLTAKVVLPVRQPEEVFASLSSMAGRRVPRERLSQSWLEIYLQAERHSRDLPRVFIEYSSLLRDWRNEVRRVADSLSIELRVEGAGVDEFLTRDLHRQRHAGQIIESQRYPWISQAYKMLSIAADDGAVDTDSFDNLYAAYRASAEDFNLLMDEYQRWGFELRESREKLNDWPVWASG